MDEAFEKMKKEGKNDVDSLVKWMKDCKNSFYWLFLAAPLEFLTGAVIFPGAKIIDGVKVTEQKVKDLFKDAANKNSIELEKFKPVLTKVAQEQNKTLDEFSKSLADLKNKGEKVLGAASAAATAFKEAMKK
ncbi:uncharacterized protein LOC128681903 isoform X1 [Plodia interpunctella]|uniref:uncharacterized protein LOC128681903 isoform X1 n=1 Tax=Plodia interpunctella TaxID=58824 RepID=UPI002368A3B8|nr:uncharacterized protein LOC128681903 isoform X1 [Plodia interpunctella]XP_053622185.1 uncharacterized protein LOC128681903 isoform X1 [Plodia interpunctella]XP_053622186.1 uncharacterized protein LOC128681903 isoform X1 [Plodia interpunctella]